MRPLVTSPVTSPIADWADDLADDLDDAADDLGGSSAIIGNSEGPLSEPQLSLVAAALQRVVEIIDRIEDPDIEPSLDPPDAGAINQRITPTTLPEYARAALDLILDARIELGSPAIDHEQIGSDLKTIRHLIERLTPHSYRDKAGIDTGA